MGHQVFKHIAQTILLILLLVISAQSKSAEKPTSFQDNGVTYYTNFSGLQKADRRKKKTKSSPAYLDAVGRIKTVRTNGQVSYCSGTLISAIPGQSSRVIKSAGHCFGNTETESKYDIKSITWKTTTKSGLKIVKDLNIEELNLERDSAVLSFNGKIPFSTIKPALIETELSMHPSEFIRYDNQTTVISAGYSSDNLKGDNGKTLTYDDQIRAQEFINLNSYDRRKFGIQTVSFSGASGGALLVDVDLSYEDIDNPYKQVYYVGTTITLGYDTKYYKESSSDVSTGSESTNYDSYLAVDGVRFLNTLNK